MNKTTAKLVVYMFLIMLARFIDHY